MPGLLRWLLAVRADTPAARRQCRALVVLTLALTSVSAVGTLIGAPFLEPWRTWVHAAVVAVLVGTLIAARAGRPLAAAAGIATAGLLAGLVPVLVSGQVRTWPLFVPVVCVTLLYLFPLRGTVTVAAGGLLVLAVMALCAHDPGAPIGTPAAEMVVDCALLLVVLTAVHAYGAVTTRNAQDHEREARARAAELADLAVRDGLTGLYNRRFADAVVPRLVAEAARTGRPLAVALADLDRFKHVNDTYGHAAGDAVLVEVAAALAGACRASDLPVRYGGDEFLLLMPDTSAAQAAAVCERVRARLAGRTVEVAEGSGRRQTLSVGVATTAPPPSGPDAPGQATTAAGLVAAADAALLAAKAAGRDRTATG